MDFILHYLYSIDMHLILDIPYEYLAKEAVN
jgi:hypothetical protein